MISHFLAFLFGFVLYDHLFCYWRDFGDLDSSEFWHLRFDDTVFYIAVNSFTIVLDIAILIIPYQAVLQLQLPKKQKLIILGIVCAGIMYETSLLPRSH